VADDLTFVIDENSSGVTLNAESLGNSEVSPRPYRSDSTLNITEAMYYIKGLMDRWAPEIRFVPAYPDDIIESRADLPDSIRKTANNPVISFVDTITYKVVRREPAHVGAGGAFGPKKELKPRLREQYVKSEENSEDTYEIWGQRFENLVQFDCWAKSNYEVDQLIYWFEGFLYMMAGPIKQAGVAEMYYWSRREDETVTNWKTPLNHRSLVYYFTTERLITVKHNIIHSITVELERIRSQMNAFT
jgi:hypothetical protein